MDSYLVNPIVWLSDGHHAQPRLSPRSPTTAGHMVVPDRAPGHEEPGALRQAWAYEFGHIKAMIQAVNGGV